MRETVGGGAAEVRGLAVHAKDGPTNISPCVSAHTQYNDEGVLPTPACLSAQP